MSATGPSKSENTPGHSFQINLLARTRKIIGLKAGIFGACTRARAAEDRPRVVGDAAPLRAGLRINVSLIVIETLDRYLLKTPSQQINLHVVIPFTKLVFRPQDYLH